MGFFGRRYRYIVAEDGLAPQWDAEHSVSFCNPVSVGEFIKPRSPGEGLRKVVRVVHYREGSVLYTIPERSAQKAG